MLENRISPNRINAIPNYNNNVNNTSPGNPVGVVKGIQQSKTLESDSTGSKDVPPYRQVELINIWGSLLFIDVPSFFIATVGII